MATLTYEAGNTIRIKATFRDWVAEGAPPGDVIPDDDISFVYVKLFDVNKAQIGSTEAYDMEGPGSQPPIVKVSIDLTTSYFYYDWILPDPGNYYIEFSADVSGEPILIRLKVKTKWDVTE